MKYLTNDLFQISTKLMENINNVCGLGRKTEETAKDWIDIEHSLLKGGDFEALWKEVKRFKGDV